MTEVIEKFIHAKQLLSAQFSPHHQMQEMLALMESNFWYGLRTHLSQKTVQSVLAFVSFVSVLALFLTVITTSSNTTSQHVNSPVLMSGPGLQLANFKRPEALTILGPIQFAEEDNATETVPEEPEGKIVRISGQGSLRGAILKSRKGRDYNAFFKIPYARPPVGRNRFEPPKSPRRWFGIRNATVPGKECIQKEKYSPIDIAAGEEDCLYLNIYTPKVPENGGDSDVSLPVMFYIHGGGVYGNGTRYGAKYFMDENVVLITFEFRIGILGGFTLGTEDYSGNLGNKDIIMALKWVQRNIKAFGGDPKRVTVFGNSSGGIHVHMLLLSKLSEGLFQRAIMQSGTALAKDSDVLMTDPVALVQNFSKEVGCDRYWGNERRLIRCLRDVKAEEIVLTKTQLKFGEFAVEDPEYSGAFLTDKPWNLIQSGDVMAVPMITGVQSNEFAHVATAYLTSSVNLNQNFDQLFPKIVPLQDDANHTIAEHFRQVYFDDRPINNDTRQAVFDLCSDKFVHAARVSGMLHTYKTGEPVYFYWFNKEPAKSYAESVRKVFPGPYGASHADELQFMFLYAGYPEITVDSPWFYVSETIVRLWVSYAAEGRPISPTAEWKPIDLVDDGMIWFKIDDQLGPVEPFTERMQLWDEYIDELYGDPQPVDTAEEDDELLNEADETFNNEVEVRQDEEQSFGEEEMPKDQEQKVLNRLHAIMSEEYA